MAVLVLVGLVAVVVGGVDRRGMASCFRIDLAVGVLSLTCAGTGLATVGAAQSHGAG